MDINLVKRVDKLCVDKICERVVHLIRVVNQFNGCGRIDVVGCCRVRGPFWGYGTSGT